MWVTLMSTSEGGQENQWGASKALSQDTIQHRHYLLSAGKPFLFIVDTIPTCGDDNDM